MLEADCLFTTCVCTKWQIWAPCDDSVPSDLWAGTSFCSTIVDQMTGMYSGDWRVIRAIQSLWKKLGYFSVVLHVRQIVEALPFHLQVHSDLTAFQTGLVPAKRSRVGNTCYLQHCSDSLFWYQEGTPSLNPAWDAAEWLGEAASSARTSWTGSLKRFCFKSLSRLRHRVNFYWLPTISQASYWAFYEFHFI